MPRLPDAVRSIKTALRADHRCNDAIPIGSGRPMRTGVSMKSRACILIAMALTIGPAARAAAEGNVCVENATIAELQQALADGRTNASTLTRAYLARIEA